MAKGTKYSDVHFSIPEGADPLGIGVPDLGRSSYDPLATIRQGWDESKQERLMKQQQRSEEYQSFLDNLPSYEAINQKVAGKLNEKVVKMGQLAHQKFKSGAWSPFARTQEGLSTERELGRLQNEVITEGEIYNAMLPKYKDAQEYVSNPENRDKIDWDLTQSNMLAFTNAEDVEGMTKALDKPLVVLRPEPVELNKYLDTLFDMYIPSEDKKIVSEVFDPEINKWKITTKTYKDPERVTEGMKKVYDNMDEKYKNEVKRRYLSANQDQKTTKDGVPIPEKDWFISQFVPEYGEKLDLKTYTGAGKGATFNWDFILPGKREDGLIDLSDYEEVRQIGVQTGADETEMQQINSAATIPLQSISRSAFVMPNTPNTRDAETGKQSPGGRSTMNLMDNVSILPIATETFEITMPDGAIKTITAGEKIPKDVQAQMGRDGMLDKMTWQAFLTTLTSNKQVPTELEYQGISLGTKVSSFTETTIRPWNESIHYVKSAALEKEIDITPLVNKVDAILNQLNSDYNKVFETVKGKSDEENYNLIFGENN